MSPILKRVLVGVVGGLITILGVVALIAPGPGWLIIFAGFIVYLIWGFVFDFTIESYEKLDKVRLAIKSKEDDLKANEQSIEKMNLEINKLEETEIKNRGEINKLKEKRIESSIFFIFLPLVIDLLK